MRLLRDIPIDRKLKIITMLTSCVALLLACIAFVTYEQVTFRRTMIRDSSILADIFGNNVASGLTFNDSASMEQTLKALSAQPHVVGAAVYDKGGQVAAKYERKDLQGGVRFPSLRDIGSIFGKDRLETFQKITLGGEGIGTVYIAADLTELSARFWRYAGIVGLTLVISSLVALMLSVKLCKVISEPVSHLANIANVVATEKNYSVRAVKQSGDELGQLIDGFNEMLVQIQERDADLRRARDDLEKRVNERTQSLQEEVVERKQVAAKLEETHKQLLEISRQAGMAEVATSVLHNVGNVLNSVNVSSNLVADSLKKSKAANLTKVVALMREHQADLGTFFTKDPKGTQLPAYLAQLAEHLAAEQSSNIKELQELTNNIEHIKDIVAMQQSYAKVSGVVETVQVSDLVEDALRMNAGALTRHDVQVTREYDPHLPSISVEKHKVLQILVNLIRNAKYACEECSRADKRMTVRVTNGDNRVRITVSDNGVGIPQENLTRIFNHGFTTRKDGHGFGLHNGALAAKEMGGSLSVHSDGPGQGAAFTLELPLQPLNSIHD